MLVLVYFLGKFSLKMDKVMIRCGGEDFETVKDVGGVCENKIKCVGQCGFPCNRLMQKVLICDV